MCILPDGYKKIWLVETAVKTIILTTANVNNEHYIGDLYAPAICTDQHLFYKAGEASKAKECESSAFKIRGKFNLMTVTPVHI